MRLDDEHTLGSGGSSAEAALHSPDTATSEPIYPLQTPCLSPDKVLVTEHETKAVQTRQLNKEANPARALTMEVICLSNMGSSSINNDINSKHRLRKFLGRLILIHLRCWEMLPLLTIQRQRCIKFRILRAWDFYTPLALNSRKRQHLSAPEMYKKSVSHSFPEKVAAESSKVPCGGPQCQPGHAVKAEPLSVKGNTTS